MKKAIVFACALVVGSLVSNGAMATVPDLIPVQGVLADSGGTPLDGAYDLTFSLYAAETGETALWSDAFLDVDVLEGFFTVYLGSQAALDLTEFLGNEELWIGLNVEGDGEMDRIRLAAVPFAVEAQVCRAVGSLTEADINANFAPSGHDHDTDYAAIGHDHDADYAAIGHDHDADYAPVSHAHAWSTITDIPSGFADGVDNNTTYTAGLGLSLTGTTFSANLAFVCEETADTNVSVAVGGTENAIAPACPAGYVATSTQCESTSWNMPIVYSSGETCSARNNGSTAATLRASRVCCRVQLY